MCLILLAWQAHPDYPLVVAANRDEFFARPSAAADFWGEAPNVLAGRDLEAGGTWLGISRQHRFAALTNYRDGLRPRADSPSRGALVSDFLTGSASPEAYLTGVRAASSKYNGFNLLVGDEHRLGYFSNRHPDASAIRWLAPGLYGLSNHLLDTPWPKLSAAKMAFAQALDKLPQTDDLFALLADDETVADSLLPQTGVSLARERVLSAIFVRSPDYGTRASTVLSVKRSGEVSFAEKRFGQHAQPLGEVLERFQFSEISTGV